MYRILIIAFAITSFISKGFAQDFSVELSAKLDSLSDLEKVQYLSQLCWELNSISNEESIMYGEYALRLSDSLGFYSEASEVSNYLGVAMLYYAFNTKMAWFHFRESLNFATHSNDSIQLGYAYDNIGYMYFLHRNLPNALEYTKNALQIFETLNDKRGLGYINTSLGLIYTELKEYKKAFEHLNNAILFHSEVGNINGLAATNSCLGNAFLEQKKYNEAKTIFENQIKLATKSDNKKYIALGYKGLGDISYFTGDYEQGLDYLNQALKINIDKNDFFDLVETRISIAMVLAKTNKQKEGEQELQMALETAQAIGLPKKIFNIYNAYSRFYLNANTVENAAFIFKNLFHIYDSLYTEYEKEILINEEQRIEINRDLNEAKASLELEKKEKQYFYIILALLLILGFVLLWRYNSNLKLNKKLAVTNQELNFEIHNKNEALKALKQSETDLKTSNNAKSRLFSIIAHDLKNPFNSILGFADLLLSSHNDVDQEEREEYIKLLHESSFRVYRLVENLLIWAGTQTDKIKFNPQKANISSALSENIDLFQDIAAQKQIRLKTDCYTDIYGIVDIDMIKAVFRNLISNAIKFTPSDGEITIITKIKNANGVDSFEFSIEDNGIGIPSDKLKNLFVSNEISSTPGTNNEKGTGLGLMLCFELVKKHNGILKVESNPGKGSLFRISIPI